MKDPCPLGLTRHIDRRSFSLLRTSFWHEHAAPLNVVPNVFGSCQKLRSMNMELGTPRSLTQELFTAPARKRHPQVVELLGPAWNAHCLLPWPVPKGPTYACLGYSGFLSEESQFWLWVDTYSWVVGGNSRIEYSTNMGGIEGAKQMFVLYSCILGIPPIGFLLHCPGGPSTPNSRTPVPKTIPSMVFGTRVLRYLHPSSSPLCLAWLVGLQGLHLAAAQKAAISR